MASQGIAAHSTSASWPNRGFGARSHWSYPGHRRPWTSPGWASSYSLRGVTGGFHLPSAAGARTSPGTAAPVGLRRRSGLYSGHVPRRPLCHYDEAIMRTVTGDPLHAIVITGVAGAGKTTVGRAVASRLRCTFADADDFHAIEDIEQMRAGVGLTDTQREPWLRRLRTLIERAIADDAPLVLACSALRASYRQQLSGGLDGVRYVYLAGDRALFRERLASRLEHFAGAALLDSQLATLEPPLDALILDAALPLPVLVDAICAGVEPAARQEPESRRMRR